MSAIKLNESTIYKVDETGLVIKQKQLGEVSMVVLEKEEALALARKILEMLENK